MAELARGNITDRPWGQTFGRLGSRGLTGQLDVVADGKQFNVAFMRGAVVSAWSPLPNDALARIALTGHLVTSTQVSEIARRVAAPPQRDELEVIAEIARLSPEQVQRLRRRAIAQRAARTFALERGEFVVEDRVSLPVVAGSELDVRAVIYLGARSNLSEERLERDVAQLGAWFRIKPEAVSDLAQYGFTEAEKGVLRRLVAGASLADLALEEPELDNRGVRAIVYALACYGACETTAPPGVVVTARTPARPSARPVPTTRQPLVAPPMVTGASDIEAPTAVPRREPTQHPPAAAGSGPTPSRTRSTRSTMNPPPAVARTKSTGPAAAPARSSRLTATTSETERLIAVMAPLVDRGADHFELLGVGIDASTEQVRNAYFNLARKLHPDKLSSLGISDAQRQAQRLFAQINAAFATLTDAQRRAEYVEIQRQGGQAAVRATEDKIDELASKVLRAEEAFKQGEMALRREQFDQAMAAFTTACELQPDEPDYQALLAWAKFAAAPDKAAVAAATRTVLNRAADDSHNSVTARFYLGRVERMLGREREALQHFQEVLRSKPHHGEAASEARILEQRLKSRR